MRIIWSIHLYPPKHNCGSELMAHQINKFLISRGHQVKVFLHDAKKYNINSCYSWEGVNVFVPDKKGFEDQAYRWADVIFTHLDYTQFSIVQARSMNIPIVHFVHNDIPYASIKGADRNNFVVYNSQWIADKKNYQWPYTIINPPCDKDYYNVNEDPFNSEYIALISLNQNKGGLILEEIAKRMPDRKFLGVVGSYDNTTKENPVTQDEIIRRLSTLPNVTILRNTPDILPIYKQTRILLMPSEYESWGRTASEAMCSGIPVICTPTPGLKENCGDAAIYVERDNIDGWVTAIKSLDSKKTYNQMRKKAKVVDTKSQLEQFEDFLYQIKNKTLKAA